MGRKNPIKWSIGHRDFSPHHRYQIEIILLFVAGFFLFIPYFIFIEELFLDMQVWQWAFFYPWVTFYVLYSLKTRKTITKYEQINPLKRPVVHWVLLGISLIVLHQQPADPTDLQSLDLMFGIFSLFLADSYWDFKDIKFWKKL